MFHKRVLGAFLLPLLGVSSSVLAGSSQDKFYRAYYLENSAGDYAAAADLYAEVAKDGRADTRLAATAEERLQVCREEQLSYDFSSLMPPNALAYVEFKRPGDQILRLLEKLGLLAGEPGAGVKGGQRLAISPALVKELLGIRGVAAALTGFDLMRQTPSGVVVFHPGNVAVVRGLLETGLPLGGKPTDAIGGFPTYRVDDKVLITLTSRLVVISAERAHIEGVVRRLQGKETSSLATSGILDEYAKDREDSLLFFCVNVKALMPMIDGMMALAGGSREVAIARALLDPKSLRSITGRLGIGEEGIFLDLGLALDAGHRNLVYNFLRTPSISRETLKCIPKGVAGFLAGALNETPSRFGSTAPMKTDTAPVVTALDIGREIFANITSMAVYALPPDDERKAGGPAGSGRPPFPDVAAVFTVKDPSQSMALWRQFLGIASIATGMSTLEGSPIQIQGHEVHTYRLPSNVTIFVTTVGNDLLISPSRSAIARSIRAKETGQSVLQDPAYRQALSRLSPDCTKALILHIGRLAAIARQFMPASEAAKIEPFLPMLSETVASLDVEHSEERLRLSVLVSGIPDVSELVAGLITKGQAHREVKRELHNAMDKGNWDEALVAADAQLAEKPDDIDLLKSRLKILAKGKKDGDAAVACADQIIAQIHDDAKALNNFAWKMLTSEPYKDRFDKLALRASERSNELTDYESWTFMDTLALAKFRSGDVEGAVDTQKKALKLSRGRAAEELKGRLAKFEAALAQRHKGHESG